MTADGPAPINHPRVVVVDSDRGICRLLRRHLGEMEFVVETARTGQQALELIRRARPDLAILSTNVDDLCGPELVERVRALCDAPILALTQPGGSVTARQVLNSGADDSVDEPFLLDDLIARIQHLLPDLGKSGDENAGVHDFDELLMIALCAVIAGGQSTAEMALFARAKEPFLRGFLNLKHGLPNEDTFNGLLRQLDPERFQAAFERLVADFALQCRAMAAVNDNVLRRSFEWARRRSPWHTVSVRGGQHRLGVAQIAGSAKNSAKAAVPVLIKMLSLKGAIVIADAVICQRAIARHIVDQCGNYALGLDSRTGPWHDDVGRYLEGRGKTPMTLRSLVYPGRDGIEKRQVTVFRDIDCLPTSHRWPGLTAIGRVVRIRETAASATVATTYYLLSAELSAEQLNQMVSRSWYHPEKLHWRFEVVTDDRRSRARSGNGPQNLLILRSMALNAMRNETSTGTPRSKFKRAGWDEAYLATLLVSL